MIKRCLCLLLGCVMAGMASAQVSLQQKVARAVQEAPAKAAANAERRLIDAYHDGLVTVVDDILMQNPGLANASIIGEDGQRISMVYDAFLHPRRIPTEEYNALQERVKQAREAYYRSERRLNRVVKRFWFYDDQIDKGPIPGMFFTFPAMIAEKEWDNLVDKYCNQEEQLQRLERDLACQAEIDSFMGDNPMLEVFYAHGAKCQECLNASLNQRGWLTPSQMLSLLYQLPVDGAPADKIMQSVEWIYFPTGGNIRDVSFQNPVIMDDQGNVYDARPETFGNKLL